MLAEAKKHADRTTAKLTIIGEIKRRKDALDAEKVEVGRGGKSMMKNFARAIREKGRVDVPEAKIAEATFAAYMKSEAKEVVSQTPLPPNMIFFSFTEICNNRNLKPPLFNRRFSEKRFLKSFFFMKRKTIYVGDNRDHVPRSAQEKVRHQPHPQSALRRLHTLSRRNAKMVDGGCGNFCSFLVIRRWISILNKRKKFNAGKVQKKKIEKKIKRKSFRLSNDFLTSAKKMYVWRFW